MKAIIIVPNTGKGEIEKILSLEDAAQETPGSGLKKVEVDAPGVPIASVHWDGAAVASGSYVSPEQEAERAAQAAIEEAAEKIAARKDEVFSMMLKVIEREGDTLHLTADEKTLIASSRSEYADLEALK